MHQPKVGDGHELTEVDHRVQSQRRAIRRRRRDWRPKREPRVPGGCCCILPRLKPPGSRECSCERSCPDSKTFRARGKGEGPLRLGASAATLWRTLAVEEWWLEPCREFIPRRTRGLRGRRLGHQQLSRLADVGRRRGADGKPRRRRHAALCGCRSRRLRGGAARAPRAVSARRSAAPVLICGMAGARQGWAEAPYLRTPTRLDALHEGAIRIDAPGDIRILPGIAQAPTCTLRRHARGRNAAPGRDGTGLHRACLHPRHPQQMGPDRRRPASSRSRPT